MVGQNKWRVILKKIAIVSKHKGISGSPINLLDFQDYLIRNDYDVVFNCYNKWYLQDIIKNSLRRYKTGKIKEIDEVIVHRRKNVVTDFVSLIKAEPIVCKKLIVFDNAELSYHLNGITNFFYKKDIGDLNRILDKHHFSEILFLMPKVNYEKFEIKYPYIPATIFYKKINIQALLTVPFSDNQKWFFRGERDDNEPDAIVDYYNQSNQLVRVVDRLKGDALKKMFDYSGYIYYRRADRSKFEQFGRSIFEFLIMGKKVHYVDHPNDVNDGLKDYWNHYGKGDKEIVRMMMCEDYTYKPWE